MRILSIEEARELLHLVAAGFKVEAEEREKNCRAARNPGPLLPMNFRRKRWVLCRAMNWRYWPDDILRHSYGSYHLAKQRNAALTAEQMGHKDARMLYAHYPLRAAKVVKYCRRI